MTENPRYPKGRRGFFIDLVPIAFAAPRHSLPKAWERR